MAVQLWSERDSALSGTTAARIWGLDVKSSNIELTTTRQLRPPVGGVTIRRVEHWRPFEVVRNGAFTVTHPCRTLLDLAANGDSETVETALNISLHRRLVSIERLARYLKDTPRGTKGLAVLKALLKQRDEDRAVPVNRFETKLMRLLRTAHLPQPQSQFEVVRPDGHRALIDFAYPHAMVAIETDGYQSHGDYAAWNNDRARRNDLEAMGWRVIQITYRQLCDEPEKVIELVRALLQPPIFEP